MGKEAEVLFNNYTFYKTRILTLNWKGTQDPNGDTSVSSHLASVQLKLERSSRNMYE